jgi:hypothetical protein
MRESWEYATLNLKRDPRNGDVTGFLAFPGDDKWSELGKVESPLSILNRVGADGWELVGQPSYEHAAFKTDPLPKAEYGVDRAWWIEARYVFKRQVTR